MVLSKQTKHAMDNFNLRLQLILLFFQIQLYSNMQYVIYNMQSIFILPSNVL